MEEGSEVRDMTKSELAVCRERLLRDNAQLSARVRRLERGRCPWCRLLSVFSRGREAAKGREGAA
jgi:hypothetical protein